MEEFEFTAEKRMPVLPIRGISVFPGTMLTFDVEKYMRHRLAVKDTDLVEPFEVDLSDEELQKEEP